MAISDEEFEIRAREAIERCKPLILASLETLVDNVAALLSGEREFVLRPRGEGWALTVDTAPKPVLDWRPSDIELEANSKDRLPCPKCKDDTVACPGDVNCPFEAVKAKVLEVKSKRGTPVAREIIFRHDASKVINLRQQAQKWESVMAMCDKALGIDDGG